MDKNSWMWPMCATCNGRVEVVEQFNEEFGKKSIFILKCHGKIHRVEIEASFEAGVRTYRTQVMTGTYFHPTNGDILKGHLKRITKGLVFGAYIMLMLPVVLPLIAMAILESMSGDAHLGVGETFGDKCLEKVFIRPW